MYSFNRVIHLIEPLSILLTIFLNLFIRSGFDLDPNPVTLLLLYPVDVFSSTILNYWPIFLFPSLVPTKIWKLEPTVLILDLFLNVLCSLTWRFPQVLTVHPKLFFSISYSWIQFLNNTVRSDQSAPCLHFITPNSLFWSVSFVVSFFIENWRVFVFLFLN